MHKAVAAVVTAYFAALFVCSLDQPEVSNFTGLLCLCSSFFSFFSRWLFMLFRNSWSWLCQTFRWHIWPSWLVTLHELSLSASSTTAGVGTWRPDLWVLAVCVSGSRCLHVHYVVCLLKISNELIILFFFFVPIQQSNARFLCRVNHYT